MITRTSQSSIGNYDLDFCDNHCLAFLHSFLLVTVFSFSLSHAKGAVLKRHFLGWKFEGRGRVYTQQPWASPEKSGSRAAEPKLWM